MKKVLMSVVALLVAAMMLVSFAACGGNETPDETTTAPVVEDDSTVAADAPVEDSSAPVEETEAPSEAESTEAASDVEETEAPTEAESTEEATEAVVAPTSVADIVALYNEATAKAKSSKAGYSKTVKTELQSLEMGAIGKIDAVRSTVGDFLGEGTETAAVKKGTASDELLKSTLSAADVTAATCKLSADGKYYEVTITVKNETNPLKGKSALNKYTDDYKDDKEMLAGLQDVDANAETITLNVKTATIKAKIAVEDMSFSSIDYVIKTDALLTNVKYIVSVKKVTGTIYTEVSYSKFAY